MLKSKILVKMHLFPRQNQEVVPFDICPPENPSGEVQYCTRECLSNVKLSEETVSVE